MPCGRPGSRQRGRSLASCPPSPSRRRSGATSQGNPPPPCEAPARGSECQAEVEAEAVAVAEAEAEAEAVAEAEAEETLLSSPGCGAAGGALSYEAGEDDEKNTRGTARHTEDELSPDP